LNDLIADNPEIAFACAVLVSTLAGASLLVIAWRSRRRPFRASTGAVAAIALLLTGRQLAVTYAINRDDRELQRRTGIDVSSYSLWTVSDGVQHQLSEFRGKPVLLYRWATTCGPCRPSLPVLAQLASDVQGRATVILLSHEERATLLEYAKRRRIPAIAAYAPDSLVPPGRTWAFPQAPLPTVFLIDSQSVVRRTMVGRRSREHLRTLLEQLAAEPVERAVQH
jgi:thiol-disulfide isomerase/thioredoxin